MSQSTQQTYEFFIRATPEQVWNAITRGEQTQQYFYGTSLKGTLKKGEKLTWGYPDGSVAVDGVVAEVEPQRRLTHSWVVHYDPRLTKESSQVTWSIEPRGAAAVKLTLTHALQGAPLTAESVAKDGWSMVLSGLKTLVETGAPLPLPPPGA